MQRLQKINFFVLQLTKSHKNTTLFVREYITKEDEILFYAQKWEKIPLFIANKWCLLYLIGKATTIWKKKHNLSERSQLFEKRNNLSKKYDPLEKSYPFKEMETLHFLFRPFKTQQKIHDTKENMLRITWQKL